VHRVHDVAKAVEFKNVTFLSPDQRRRANADFMLRSTRAIVTERLAIFDFHVSGEEIRSETLHHEGAIERCSREPARFHLLDTEYLQPFASIPDAVVLSDLGRAASAPCLMAIAMAPYCDAN
jgi:hypothetical protein